jgi:hypothetical protein
MAPCDAAVGTHSVKIDWILLSGATFESKSKQVGMAFLAWRGQSDEFLTNNFYRDYILQYDIKYFRRLLMKQRVHHLYWFFPSCVIFCSYGVKMIQDR